MTNPRRKQEAASAGELFRFANVSYWAIHADRRHSQAVNIASRVQGLAASRTIFATGPVVEHPDSSSILETSSLEPVRQRIADEVVAYEIP